MASSSIPFPCALAEGRGARKLAAGAPHDFAHPFKRSERREIAAITHWDQRAFDSAER
jgi:hypothetical protein